MTTVKTHGCVITVLCGVFRDEQALNSVQQRALACTQEQEVGILILLYHGQQKNTTGAVPSELVQNTQITLKSQSSVERDTPCKSFNLKDFFVSFNHSHYLSTASSITVAVATSTHQSTFDHKFHLFTPTIGLCVLFNITFDLLILFSLCYPKPEWGNDNKGRCTQGGQPAKD